MADQYKCYDCGDIAIRNHHTCLGPREASSCDCDPEVGFFCVHCAMENNYIQDLQDKLIALEAENARYREALDSIFNNYCCYNFREAGLVAREALKEME